jgi:Mg2+-importing ATPase
VPAESAVRPVTVPTDPAAAPTGSPTQRAASQPATDTLVELSTTAEGLTSAEAAARLDRDGPNAVRSHHVGAWTVLRGQFASPLLWLLIAAAGVSAVVGEAADAIVISIILTASVGLGFVNEYRAQRAAAALHNEIRQLVLTHRDGRTERVDATSLVVGDIIQLDVGSIVPADLRLLSATGLECDESILTGESVPSEKSPDPVPAGTALADLSACLFMGTVVHEGSASAVVVATGARTEFGAIALGLGDRHPQTDFQRGLAQFSGLLAKVAGVLSLAILVVNLLLGRRVIDAVLFSLAVAVGITPQLLPAVVATSLATGARRLAHKKVLVKRTVCIEDLGDIDVLFTDKTGTLTDGHISFRSAMDATGAPSEEVFRLGLVCNQATVEDGRIVGGNPLDVATWEAQQAGDHGPAPTATVLGSVPFDHDRRALSVLVDDNGQRRIVTKGAPESVLPWCTAVPDGARSVLDTQFQTGSRVVAVATRPVTQDTITKSDEHDLTLVGLLTFLDQPKPSATDSIQRLKNLGIDVKIVTGDNVAVAEHVAGQVGLESGGSLSGSDIDQLGDAELLAAVQRCGIFARVSPEQKARIVSAQRGAGSSVAFMGDGVNDALALHHSDVGISVNTATDVAKDAADIILLEQDLGVVADGVAEGRRIFANTIKYVLMGTSSNFGNMFSVTVAAAFLPFLPMLPMQILLNNLLYDTSQLTIPSDHVDEEQIQRPSHWDIAFIRRFMIRFGPISSIFDFATFMVMLWGFHATAPLFRAGWFVESLATQILIVFVIRTRRVPFFRSRPSAPLLWSVIAMLTIGVVLPQSPLRDTLGFAPLPWHFYVVLGGFVVAYLLCVEVAKYFLLRSEAVRTDGLGADANTPARHGLGRLGASRRRTAPQRRARRVNRLAANYSHRLPLPKIHHNRRGTG